MKTRTGKIIFSSIVGAVGIITIIILLVAIKTDRKSEQEIKEIDTFIESIEEETYERTGVSTDMPAVADNRNIRDIRNSDDNSNISESASESEEVTLSAEELAQMVIDNGINGDARKAELGDRYEEVQKWIDANYEPPTVEYYEPEVDYYYPSGDVLTPDAGINYYNGVLETYYNMDMSGVVDWMHQLGYEGDYWVRSDGVKMFGNYVMVAADYDYEPKGTITETSLGLGIVCDTGLGGWAWHDIATTW